MNKFLNNYLDKLQAAEKIKNPKESKQATNDLVSKIISDAKSGDRLATVAYCILLIQGSKVEANPVSGREKLTKMISKQRCPEAMFVVAVACHNGLLGYNVDKKKSEGWFRELAISNDVDIEQRKRAAAALCVAEIYTSDDVFTKDLAEAGRFYEIAFDYGCRESALMLGKMYLSGAEGTFGETFPKDSTKGLKILQALAGNKDATEAIASHHFNECLKICKNNSNVSELIQVTLQSLQPIEWRHAD